jgi:5-methylthioadenosine/S-adenosylhomocysteine deaminase
MPVTDLIRNLMYSSGSKSIRSVIVDGRVVLEDGRFTTLDETEAFARIGQASRAVLGRMGHRVEPNRVEPRPRKRGGAPAG